MHRKFRRLLGGFRLHRRGGAPGRRAGRLLATNVPVGMVEFAYIPRATVIAVGDSVTWTNNGAARHTATSDQGVFSSGALTNPATPSTPNSFTFAFQKGGVYPYFCAIGNHRAQGMIGTVTVLDAPITPRVYVAVARLSGSQEVPPVSTVNQGVAVFRLDRTGTALEYDLTAAPIPDVSLAHIHFGQEGVNGPVVVNLYPSSDCRTGPAGLRCSGTITSDRLINLLAGKSLGDLLGAMHAGDAYVNVHSSAHPGGVVRGQIETAAILR